MSCTPQQPITSPPCFSASLPHLPPTSPASHSISAWDAGDGKLVRVFKGHGHWVNSLALSTEHALRTGAYDHNGEAPSDPAEAQAQALQR